MFSTTDGIAISRGRGREVRGEAYRFSNGEWTSFYNFPYSDYPLIATRDSLKQFWTIHHLTHDGAYRPVHTEFVNGKKRKIPLPNIMWDEIDYVMYKGIHQFSDGTAWMVGQQGHILYYNGTRWNEVESPLIHHDRTNVYEGDLNDVFMLSAQSGWAVGRDGIILHFQDGAWSRVPSPTQQHLHAVAFADEDHGWAVGERGTILRWDGHQWNREDVDIRERLTSVKVIDTNNVWVVGYSSTLLHFNGTAWNRDASITMYEDNFADIDVVKDTNGALQYWIIGDYGIYTTFNSTGFSFTDITAQASLRRVGRGGIFFNRSSEEFPDLLVLNDGGIDLLYENNDKNVFSDVTESAGLLEAPQNATVSAVGDVNNDGNIDLLQVVNHTNFRLYFGTIFGGFRDATEFSQLRFTDNSFTGHCALRFVDLNNDGNLDLYVSQYDLPDQIFRNDGTGRFTEIAESTGVNKLVNHSSYGAAFGDFNDDGLIDIFIPYYVSYKRKFFDLYLNQGNFRFRSVVDSVFYSRLDISPTVAVTQDFNNDGYCDIFVHNQKAPPYLLVNDGNAKFTNVASRVGLVHTNFHPEPTNGVVAVADVNNDGWIDIFDGSKLYLNSPEFHFTEVSERVGIHFTGNPSFADIDNDGDMDLFIGSSRGALGKGDRAALFRNNLNPPLYAKVKVFPDKSNRSAVGTTLVAGQRITTLGLHSSPLLPNVVQEEIFMLDSSIQQPVKVIFSIGNAVVSIMGSRVQVYESPLFIRQLTLLSTSVRRTFLLLDWKMEILKLTAVALLFIGWIKFGKKIGVKQVVQSPRFVVSLLCAHLLLMHLLSSFSLVVSAVVHVALVGVFGTLSLALARIIIQQREAKYISHYKILEHIGTGGMGTVYKAIDSETKSIVALKVLNAELLKDPENRRRLSAEGHLLASFNHPRIIRVFEIGESNGRGFIAMEFLSGGTLKEKLEKEHPLSIEQIKQYVLQVCDGLSEIHVKGIVHRDLKTGNIMLDEHDTVRIMDFGLSKSPLVTTMTSLGTVLGTLGYVAPEQVTSIDVDQRTDIFSLGVIMYELLTKELPFKGENEIALIHSIFNTVPPPPSSLRSDIDKTWDDVVMKCLAKDASERYASVAEVKKAIDSAT